MICVLKPNAPQEKIERFIVKMETEGFSVLLSKKMEQTIVCLVGDTAKIDIDSMVRNNAIIEYGKRILEPYKAVNRMVHPEDTLIDVGNVTIGEGFFQVIAGPCSVESEEQIIEIAKSVKKSGAALLRGGAFKPRTSPYAFQGLHETGIKFLLAAKKETGMPVITEIMDKAQLPFFDEIDVIQVGARNMQNFDLLKELGRCEKPVLLKRGFANTLEEFLMSAEYIVSAGNNRVILCERGILTFETMTRNTLDLSAIPLLKQKSHLPVVVDPSHSAGIRKLVLPLSKAAISVGADGLMIESHNNPAEALCDGAQSLDLQQFSSLMHDIRRRVDFEGKSML